MPSTLGSKGLGSSCINILPIIIFKIKWRRVDSILVLNTHCRQRTPRNRYPPTVFMNREFKKKTRPGCNCYNQNHVRLEPMVTHKIPLEKKNGKSSGPIKNPPSSFSGCAEAFGFARAPGIEVTHLKLLTSASFVRRHWCHWSMVPLIQHPQKTSTTN